MTRRNQLHAYQLDKVITLARNQHQGSRKRESLNSSSKIANWILILITGLGLNLLNLGHSYAQMPNAHEQEMWKLYAHMKLEKASEFICVNELWTRESHWNPLARGDHSTAFGIPQILGLHEHDPYRQIDAGIKYIQHRYPSACAALHHSYRYGNY